MKSKRLTVRLTDEELEIIRQKAKIAKLSLSRLMVSASLSRKIEPPIPDDIRKNIAGFGRNLNQLAHLSNATGTAAEIEAIEMLRADARKIVSAISELR
jgi:hypothetical protein